MEHPNMFRKHSNSLSSVFRSAKDSSHGLAAILQQAEKFTARSPTAPDQEYLIGFRGLLVIQAFLWVFLQTFVPVAVAASADTSGKAYQEGLRKSLSILFWNEYFLYGAVIFLSARSIAIPFLQNPKKEVIARSVMTRSITLWIPIAVSLAIIMIAFRCTGTAYLTHFKLRTENNSMTVPYTIPNAFAYFNSVYNLFWTTHQFQDQAGSHAFPSQTLWILNAVYSQSYTVYMVMVIIPYTRAKWRVQGACFFVITAWWCDSWAWYTITGLLFCDMVMTMDFKAAAQRGIPIKLPFRQLSRADGTPFRIPTWIPAGLCMIAGYTMQLLWVAWRPDLFDAEYRIHSGLYYTAGINYLYKTAHIAARDDIYLILVGFFTLLESYDFLQRFFQNRLLLYLGRRSLSYFLIQSTMIYLVGIRVFSSMRTHHNSFSGSVLVTLITCLVVIVPLAELFYRLVQQPSRQVAHRIYDFVTS